MQRDKDGRQHRHPTHHGVNRETEPEIGRAQLRQAIRLRPPHNLIEMRQVRHCSDQMVVHIAQVQDQIAIVERRETRCLTVSMADAEILGLAAFDKAVEDVDFAAERADQMRDFLAEVVDAWN